MTIAVGFALSLIQSTQPQHSTFFELLLDASPIAKGVLILLLVFSIYSWAIIITKWLWLRDAEKQTKAFLSRFQRGGKLSELYQATDQDGRSPLVRVFIAGFDEIKNQIGDGNGSIRSIDALSRVLQSATIAEVSQMERRLAWLATTANASPFIGLFGTVVGIIIAFRGLSTASASSIQSVAPGIAEALIATATGLFAAIPAVVAYNSFARQIRVLSAEMDNFAFEFLNIAERHFLK